MGNGQKADAFFYNTIRVCRRAVFYALVFSFFTNLFMLTIPLYMLQIYDRVFASYSFETLFYLTVIAILALVVYALVDAAKAQIFTNMSHWFDVQMSPEALLRSPDELLQGRTYGAQSVNDVRTLRGFIASPGFIMLFDLPWIPIYLVVISLLHVDLGILALAGSIILILLAVVNQKLTQQSFAEVTVKNILSQRQMDACLRNAEVIQAMGMMPNIVRLWDQRNDEALQIQIRATHLNAMISSVSKFLRLLLQLSVFTLGAYLVLKNLLSPGSIVAASILMSRALAPVDQAIGSWKQLVASLACFKRLREHFKISGRETMDIDLPAPQGRVDIENLSFQVPGQDKLVLNRIHLSVAPGEFIAVIGPSGAGKSTLARLIVGALKPTQGKIRLDGADVYSWKRKDFGQYVGYLPQNVELIVGTIKENIARFHEEDDQGVIDAATLADIHQLILHFPKGYDTSTSEDFNISNGQRQRIALARALYKAPKLLVLDEPNSNLDQKGEEALVKALLAMKQNGSTIFVVSHRTYLLNFVDKIIYLQDGIVQKFGPRDAVLQALQPKKS